MKKAKNKDTWSSKIKCKTPFYTKWTRFNPQVLASYIGQDVTDDFICLAKFLRRADMHPTWPQPQLLQNLLPLLTGHFSTTALHFMSPPIFRFPHMQFISTSGTSYSQTALVSPSPLLLLTTHSPQVDAGGGLAGQVSPTSTPAPRQPLTTTAVNANSLCSILAFYITQSETALSLLLHGQVPKSGPCFPTRHFTSTKTGGQQVIRNINPDSEGL